MTAERRVRPCVEPAAWLRALQLGAEEETYAATHVRRYERALVAVARALELSPDGNTLLEVAPHLSTEILRAAFPQLQLNTVGGPYQWRHAAPQGEHLDFDLNSAHRQEAWPGFHQHDVVFMGEILEHLHAAPRMVLGCIRRWIKPGGLLVLQTPNAARLWARWALLRGFNPVAPPGEGGDQGHFHEFTRQELVDLAAGLDCEVLEVSCANDYTPPDVSNWRLSMRRLLSAACPSLREAFTMIWRKRRHVLEPSLHSTRLLLHVDRIEQRGEQLCVAGWAADVVDRSPVRQLVLRSARGDSILNVRPMERPDVAAAQAGLVPASSGFIADVPLREVGDVQGAQLLALDRFGDHVRQPLPRF